MKKLNSVKGAFTLIEMLIVVTIIGILVGIGVPAIRTAKSDAEARKTEAVAQMVALAKERAILADEALTAANIAPYIRVRGGQVTAADETELATALGVSSITIGAAGDAVVVSF